MEIELENAKSEMNKILEEIRELSDQKDKYKRDSLESKRKYNDERRRNEELRDRVKSLEKSKM